MSVTVQKAVALAEGYTYRASESTVEITRTGKKFKVDVTPMTKVFPGDEIRIPERFFWAKTSSKCSPYRVLAQSTLAL